MSREEQLRLFPLSTSPTLTLYWRVWFFLRDVLRILAPVRINLIILFLLALALWVPAQSHDVFIGIAENGITHLDPGDALIAGYVFWITSGCLLHNIPPKVRKSPANLRLVRWLPYLLGVSPLVIVAIGFWIASHSLRSSHPNQHLDITLRIGLLLGAGIFLCLVTPSSMCARSKPLGGQQSTESFRRRILPRILPLWTVAPRYESVLWFVCGGAVLLGFITSMFLPEYRGDLGPVTTLLISAAFWSFGGNLLLLLLSRIRFPLVSVLAVLAIFTGASNLSDNHEIRTLGQVSTPLPEAHKALKHWINTRKDYRAGQSYPVFIVAAEGGGIRNAYWTASVLSALADKYPGFSQHLFAVCGVSGGSVGAAVYSALLAEKEFPPRGSKLKANALTTANQTTSMLAMATNVLAADLLSPVLTRGAIADLAQQFIPWGSSGIDRAEALESALEESWERVIGDERLANGFHEFYSPTSNTSSVPYLVLTTTRVETGDRFYVSHLVPGPGAISNSVFGDVVKKDLRLSTAAVLSARFPYVTPAGTLSIPGKSKMRLADGGYFENSATSTAYDLLKELLDSPPNDNMTNIYFVMVTIRYLPKPGSDQGVSGLAFGDLVSPVKCLLNTREARARFSREELVRFCLEASRLDGRVAPEVLSLDLIGAKSGVPLGWSLSSKVRQTIDQQLTEIRSEEANHPAGQAWKTIGQLLQSESPRASVKP